MKNYLSNKKVHKWIAFLMAVVMVFLGIPNYPAEAAEAVMLNVEDGAPTETGKIFAGWYTDDTYSTPYTQATGAAYPKFVDESVLTVKKQYKADTTSASATTDIRFITSIDTTNFSSVGFEVEVDCDPVKTYDLKEYKAYSSIVADGKILSDASKVFGTSDSKYFVTHSITGIPNAVFNNTFTVKPYWYTLDGTKVYGTTRSFVINEDLQADDLVTNKVTVNDTTLDMSEVIKYIDGDTAPVTGYYNYHLTNKTVTNLCNANQSILGSSPKVLYLNKVLTDSFMFETAIDMSSLDDKTNSAYARQGIVLSNGTTELAIFPARWTSGNAQDNTVEAGTGAWYVHNGTSGDFITDAGKHAGVGKCVSTNYASTITLKLVKVENTHINLYVNDALITVLKADGFYTPDGTKSAKTAFDNDLAALFASEEMVIGLNHFNALNFPNIVYNDIKIAEIDSEKCSVVDKVTVNGTIFDMSEVINYIDGDDKPVTGYYNYHLTNETVTNLCNANLSITDSTRKVLYLNRVLTGSFTFETTIDMSSLDEQTNSSYARQGIVLSNGTTELAIFPARWTSGNAQDNTVEAGTGAWYVHNGTSGDFVTDAGKHAGVGKCVSTNYASTITLKLVKVGNTHINLYVNDALITVLKPDGFYTPDGTKSAKTAFDNDLAALFASEEMVVGLNHFNALNFPNIVYSGIEFEDSLVADKVTVNNTTFDMSEVINYVDGDDAPVNGYYNYHLTNKTVTNLCNAKYSITDSTRKVLYLNKVLTGSFTFETTIDMSSLDEQTNSSYARQGIVLSNGTTELAIFPARWTSGNAQDNTVEAGTGAWYVHNGTSGDFVTDAGKHAGVGKCVSTNYASTITLKLVKVENTHINLYVNDALTTVLKPDGFYTPAGTKSTKTVFDSNLAALFASEEMVIGLNHFNTLNSPDIVYSDIKFGEIEPEKIELKESLVSEKITVNGNTFDMSEVIKYIDGDEAPVNGYYNYHLTNKTVTNLCDWDRSLAVASEGKHKVLYLNKVLTGSFTFETTIDMSSLDEKTTAAYARQGIVLSNGTNELAIFLAKHTTVDNGQQDNTIVPGTGYWYINNGSVGTFVTDAGNHAGVGKCVSTNYASKITLKVEKVGNSHINLYVEDELITVLKSDGFYKADGTKSSNTTFNNDLAALIASEEMVIGFNHFNLLTRPGIVYSDIKFDVQ